MIELSIIIISYNTKEMTLRCLKSLESLKLETEIIVVDNGSTDGTIGEIRGIGGIRGIENKENLGFAKANNIGIKISIGKYILLLNSDTIVEPKTVEAMCRYLDLNHDIGVATCRVELPDGRLDPACHRGFPTPWASLTYFLGLEKLFPESKLFGQYHLGFMMSNEPHEIDSCSGAFYLVRREVIDQVGFLDEDYFMYGEDLDWSYRIKRAGWKIMYNPLVKITHFKKQSGRDSEDQQLKKETQGHFYEAMEIFYRKHYQNKYPRWLTGLIILAIEIKKRLNIIY